jgi:hypothetical protein
MIISITVTAALDAGDGALESTPGISPAEAVPERTQASVTAIKNRFIGLFSFELEVMQKALHGTE